MNTVTKPTSDNLGGLLKIWAIPANVASLSGSTLSVSSTDEIWELYRSPGKGSFTYVSEETRAGMQWSVSVSAFIPDSVQNIDQVIDLLSGRPWLIVLMDGNGKYKLAGYDSQRKMRVNISFDTGENESSLTGTTVVFTCKSKSKPIVIGYPFGSE